MPYTHFYACRAHKIYAYTTHGALSLQYMYVYTKYTIHYIVWRARARHSHHNPPLIYPERALAPANVVASIRNTPPRATRSSKCIHFGFVVRAFGTRYTSKHSPTLLSKNPRVTCALASDGVVDFYACICARASHVWHSSASPLVLYVNTLVAQSCYDRNYIHPAGTTYADRKYPRTLETKHTQRHKETSARSPRAKFNSIPSVR